MVKMTDNPFDYADDITRPFDGFADLAPAPTPAKRPGLLVRFIRYMTREGEY